MKDCWATRCNESVGFVIYVGDFFKSLDLSGLLDLSTQQYKPLLVKKHKKKLLGFILLMPWMSAAKVMEINPAVKIY